MQLEVSTLNVLLTLVVGLQCYLVREMISLRIRITRIETRLGIDL